MKEKEMEDKLEGNLGKIEKGLTLVERQKRIATGVIDLFCKDKEGNYVVVELKKNPSKQVIVQLAKYNMALIKSGLNKKRLRTILVAQTLSKEIKEACQFFNFEVKSLYKEKSEERKKGSNKKSEKTFPEESEIVEFIKKNEFVNISMISSFFSIHRVTASEVVANLRGKNIVDIERIGRNNIVFLK